MNAAPVVTLKKTVPTSWTADAHQSTLAGSIPRSSLVGVAGSASPIACGATFTSMYCSNAAEVKNSDPTKNVAVSAVMPTQEA